MVCLLRFLYGGDLTEWTAAFPLSSASAPSLSASDPRASLSLESDAVEQCGFCAQGEIGRRGNLRLRLSF